MKKSQLRQIIKEEISKVLNKSVNEGLSTSDQQKVEKMFYAAKDKLGSRYNWKTHLTPIYHDISKKLNLNIDDVSGYLNLVAESLKESFRDDITGAKRMIDAGKSEEEVIKRYGIEAFNAVNAENEYM